MKKRAKKGHPPVEPLYSVEDAARAIRQFVSLNYDRPMQIADGVSLTFHDAGHILGSAQVLLDIKEEDGREVRYLFTGDVGRGGHAILRDPQPVQDVDVLHIESTYGNRLHGDRDMSIVEIAKSIMETAHRGGKIIIPALSGIVLSIVKIVRLMVAVTIFANRYFKIELIITFVRLRFS